MKTPFFRTLKLSPSIKQELIRVSDTVRNFVYDEYNINEQDINFFSVSSGIENNINYKNEHHLRDLSDKSWQTILDKKVTNQEYLDKFRFINRFWTLYAGIDSSGFRYHRHYHFEDKKDAIIPYQLMISYGKKATVELVEPLDFDDNFSLYGFVLADEIKTKIIGHYDVDDLEIHLMNSWTYHSLICDSPIRFSCWHPHVRNVYEAVQYVEYIESLQ
jgi:hypothetical protein